MALGEKIRQLDEQVAAAVRRALDDVRDELKTGLEQAVDDLRGRLSEVSPHLPESFFTEDTLRQLAEETAPRSEAAAAEAKAQGRAAAFGDLREALAEIDRARGQNAILGALVVESARFADRTAVLLLRPEGLVGWAARGFEADDAIRSASLPALAEGWKDLVQAESPTLPLPPFRCARLVSQLDSPLPKAAVIIPLVLRDRVSAVVYADRTAAADDGGKLEVEALQALTYTTALALETLGFREREATSTLAAALLAPAPKEPEADDADQAEPGVAEEAPAGDEEEPAAYEAAPAADEEAPAAYEEDLAADEEDSATYQDASAELPDVETAGSAIGFEPVSLETDDEPEAAPGTSTAESEVDDGWSTEPSPVETLDELDEVEELPVETIEELELDDIATASAPDERLASVDEVEVIGEEAELELDDSGFDDMPPLEDVSAGEPAPSFDEPEEAGELELDLDEESALIDQEAGAPAEDEEDASSQVATRSIPWQTGQVATPEPPAAPELTPEPPPEPPPTVAHDEGLGMESHAAEAAEPAGEPEEPEDEGSAAGQPAAGGPVEPPSDVQGPGWAFSEKPAPAAQESGDDAAHDEARRLARLLVSEIQLYNQEEVAEGRRNNDIYERLKDDIDRSRQLYEERVDPGIRESTDYFYQELVRQLGAGDSKSLGI